MTLVADESVDYPIIKQLRQDGYDVVAIVELSPSVTDERVLQEANTRQALLITADKDFGELVYRQGLLHAGVVLLRLNGLTLATKMVVVSQVFAHHVADLSRAFSVITPSLVRIRRML